MEMFGTSTDEFGEHGWIERPKARKGNRSREDDGTGKKLCLKPCTKCRSDRIPCTFLKAQSMTGPVGIKKARQKKH
jgi:hypothetical protein